MNKIFTLLAVVMMVASCDVNDVHRSRHSNIPAIYYYQDCRTENVCFTFFGSVSYVPCERVEHLIVNRTQCDKNSFYSRSLDANRTCVTK